MMTKKTSFQDNLIHFLISNAVPIIFIALSAVAIPISRFSPQYLVQEMLVRLARDSFLVLSLLIPIMAGMGLNFGMVLGAMAGEIGLILITDWNVVGIPGMLLAMIISTPLAIFLGWMCGVILNKAKGREMVTSFILGFFMNGVYQLIVLYGFGSVFPIKSPDLVLSRGFGIRNVTNLENIRKCLVEQNQVWAQHVPVLVIGIARTVFALNGKINHYAFHDLGMAIQNMALQATAMGLAVHPMAGFSKSCIRKTYNIPEEYDPMTAIAIGYPGTPDELPELLKQEELEPRERKRVREFVFTRAWGKKFTD
jgi:hypothetical protein